MSGSHLVLRYKKELQTAGELQELMELMKQVTASQFHATQETAEASRGPRGKSARSPVQSPEALAAAMEGFFRLIPPDQRLHPFFDEPSEPLGLVMLTSDEGFVGGLNASVIEQALLTPGAQQAELIIVGERGRVYLQDLRLRCTPFPSLTSRGVVERLQQHLITRYLAGRLRHVIVCYPHFYSVARQEPTAYPLLPYRRPRAGGAPAPAASPQTFVEPAGPAIIEYLVTLWVGCKLHDLFQQSRLAELAARITRLELNGRELEDRRRKVRLQYFRAKHELVDSSLRETYAGLQLGRAASAKKTAPAAGAR